MSWNDLRRTNATLLSEAGVDGELGHKLLGHSDDRMWNQVYAKPRPTALAQRLEAIFHSTNTTQLGGLVARKPEEIATARGRKPGLRSRRAEVRVLSGAPVVSCDDGYLEVGDLSANNAESVGSQRTNSTVGVVDLRIDGPDKWDLAAAYARVMARRAS